MNASSPPPRRPAALALVVFAVALVLRLVHVWQIRRAPFFTLLMGDAKGYDAWAQRIAAGEWIGGEVFYQAPLYPYFLAVLYKLIGRDLLAVRIVQSIVGAASCALLYLAARRCFSERVGLIAGVALALWAPALFFDALLQKSVLDVFFVCLVLWLLAGAEAAPAGFVLVGLAAGALALTRENALVLIIVVAGWALWRPGGLRHAAAIAVGTAIVLLPVAARNAYVGGGFFVTTSQFGPNFYIGNHAGADGTYASLRYGRGAPEYERQDATELAEKARGRALSPGEVSAYWTDQAVTYITSRPGEWLALMARKFRLLWNAAEMVDTESQETHAEWSWLLRVLGPVTHFGVLAPLALLGMMVSWRSDAPARLLIALTVAYAASVLVFYVFARYRYPLVPLLIVLAALGVSRARQVAAQRDAAALAALAAVAAMALFANWPVIPPGWLKAVSENNIAVALEEQQRYQEAIAHYEKAVALRPGYAPVINNLGTALRAAGRVDEAVAAYERAIAARGDYPEAHYNLANALTDAGRGKEAVAHFEIALASLPASADVHNNLGIALAAEGRTAEAIAQFRDAVRADPKSAKAHRNLADALLAAGGDADEGLQHMRDAATLAPDDGGIHYDLGSALLEQGRAAEAAAELEKAVARLPQSAEARNNLGIALGMSGRLDEAVVQFREALRLRPGFADARRNLDMALAARRVK